MLIVHLMKCNSRLGLLLLSQLKFYNVTIPVVIMTGGGRHGLRIPIMDGR